MQEPTPHSSRLALAGGLVALLVVAGGGFVIGRNTAPQPAPVVTATPPPMPPPPLTVVPPPTLERAALLGLVAKAADAAGSARPQPEELRSAVGRRFDLVLPFGCEGPVEGDRKTPFGWQYDAVRTTLRIWIKPVRWERAIWPRVPEDADAGEQAMEGFWIERPWSTATSCPTPSSESAVAAVDPGQEHDEVAIARRVEDDAKTNARGYEIVKRMEPGDFDPARGFTLRIVGRLLADGDGGPVQCVQPAGMQKRPQCLVRGDFAELRIENPKTGDVLGVWPLGETGKGD